MIELVLIEEKETSKQTVKWFHAKKDGVLILTDQVEEDLREPRRFGIQVMKQPGCSCVSAEASLKASIEEEYDEV